MNIVMIGAGNLATNLANALHHAGHTIEQVYSRTEESACMLAQCFNCAYTNNIKGVVMSSDLYICSLADSALEQVANQLQEDRPGQLFVHTAGSMSIDTLKSARRGVFYPMQTFSKFRLVEFTDIPIFIEASESADINMLHQLASQLSHNVYELSSEDRQYLHLAAVFACNFSNHCYRLSEKLLRKHGIPFNVMLPLIDEASKKVHLVSPKDAQTGPAKRNDMNVIAKHIDMLSDEPEFQQMYELITKSIIDDQL